MILSFSSLPTWCLMSWHVLFAGCYIVILLLLLLRLIFLLLLLLLLLHISQSTKSQCKMLIPSKSWDPMLLVIYGKTATSKFLYFCISYFVLKTHAWFFQACAKICCLGLQENLVASVVFCFVNMYFRQRFILCTLFFYFLW